MIYLDTAALVKLLRPEPESDALADWLAERPGVLLVTSVLAEVELPRALRRTTPDLLSQVPDLLARLARREIDEPVRRAAAGYADSALRSLDAIHLATAMSLAGRDLTAFVTYDRRLLGAAAAANLPVAAPGWPGVG